MKQCRNCFKEYEEEYDICPWCGYSEVDQKDENGNYYLQVGTILQDRYQVGKVLGIGGFGITYKVLDKKYNVVKAIKEYYPSGLANRVPYTTKVLHFSGKREEEFILGLKRFLLEARSMAKFSSKNIIKVYDFFEENDTGYIVMEYLEGESLSTYAKERGGKIPWKEAVSYVSDVCTALTVIHRQGVIHRDVSPDNIFRCQDGCIKLIDFGAAKFKGTEDYQRAIVLKPGFAPPEQYQQLTIQDDKTDIYSLGATLYFLLTGVKPDESVNRSIEDELKEPMQLEPDVPANVSHAIMKAMALEPSFRFQSADRFKDAICQKKKTKALQKEKKGKRLRRNIGVIAVFLILLIISAVYAGMWDQKKQKEELEEGTLVVWYQKDDIKEADTMKKNAMTTLAQEFEKSYPMIKVKVQSFLPEQYASVLGQAQKANAMPDLYECTNDINIALKEGQKLDEIIDEFDQNGLLFKNELESNYADNKVIPTAFSIPVVYANTLLTDSETTDFAKQLEKEDATCSLDEDDVTLFETLYGDTGKYKHVEVSAQSLNRFISGKTMYYFGTIEDYRMIQDTMTGHYALIVAKEDSVPCEFTDIWSVSASSNKNESKVAKKFLEYMLTDSGQDILYIQNSKRRPLPLNEKALEEYKYTYEEISPLLKNEKKFIVESVEN